MSKYIKFSEPYPSATGKTSIWEVIPLKNEHTRLGDIKWFGRWRKYAFFPLEDTVYEENCMRFISDFCEQKTKEHRNNKANGI